MKALFIILVKIIGLNFLYCGLLFFTNLSVSWGHQDPIGAQMPVVVTAQAVVSFIFSYFFLFQTETLASFLKLPDGNISLDKTFLGALLNVGIMLIGLNILATKIGSLLTGFYLRMVQSAQYNYGPYQAAMDTRNNLKYNIETVSSVLTLALALYLIFQSSKVVKFIKRFNQE